MNKTIKEENIDSLDESKIVEDNKSTVIITIALLLVLVVFFTGYSIANGPNFDKFNSYGRKPISDSSEVSSIDLSEDYNTDIPYSYLEDKNTDEKNITGEIGSANTNPIFKTDESISSKNKLGDNNKSEKSETKFAENNRSTRVESKKINSSETSNTTNKVVKKENNKPTVYNLLSYDTVDVDTNISRERPYLIQVATHNGKISAQHVRDILTLEGFSAYIFRTKIDGVDKYRIRVGTFSSKLDALKAYKDLLNKSEVKGVKDCVILKRKY